MIRQQATEDQFVLLTIGLERAIAASVLFFIGRDGYLLPAFGGDHVFIVFDVVIREHALWLIAIASGRGGCVARVFPPHHARARHHRRLDRRRRRGDDRHQRRAACGR